METIEPRVTLCKRKLSEQYGKKKYKIGSGTYSDVYETDRSYAIKHITRNIIESTVIELAVLRSLNHPNIINIIEIQMEPNVQFIMPLAYKTLRSYQIRTITERKQVYYQIMRALAYCHSRYVCHLDIKQENILVFTGGLGIYSNLPIIKLADFNISDPYIRPNIQRNFYVQTLWYRAPELMIEGQKYYTDKVDVWSVGILLLQHITKNDYIMAGNSEFEQLHRIYKLVGGMFRGSIYTSTLNNLVVVSNNTDQVEYDFLESLLKIEPNVRISSIEAIKHPYFDQVRDQIETSIQAEPIISKNIVIYQMEPNIPKTTEWLPESRRTILYEWMYEVAEEFKLKSETVFYAYILMDLFSERQELKKSDLQLYGCVVMIIGEWMYEIYPNNISEYRYISDNTYTVNEIKEGIKNLILKLDFNIRIFSCIEFIRNYVSDSKLTSKIQKYIDLILLALLLHYPNKYSQSDYAQLALQFICYKIPELESKYEIDRNLNQKPGYNSDLLTDEIKQELEAFEFNEDSFKKNWQELLNYKHMA